MRFAILLLAAACQTATAQDNGIGFKSVPLGASQSEYRSAFPDHQCISATTCLYDRVTHCLKKIVGPSEGAICDARNTWAGLTVSRIFATFHDGKLERVSITISPDSYARVVASSTERWGPPDRESTEMIQNRAGAQFENRTAEWKRDGNLLIIRKYASRVDQGNALITTVASMERTLNRIQEAPKEGAKDL